MTKKEIYELGIDFTTFLLIAKESEYPEETANAAIDMVKGILERHPKIRYELWEWNNESLLDDLGLDHGEYNGIS